MKILALETANEHCSVAIADELQILFFQHHHEPRAQTQQILPMIEQALTATQLAWKDIDAIAFSRGPGSFSGVRINAAVAQALSWANDIPVIAISSLQALAQHAYRELSLTHVSAVIDARMNEVYLGHFQIDEQGIMQAISEEQLLNYTQAKLQLTATSQLIGTGAVLVSDETYTKICYANAQDIAEIARVKFLQGHTLSAEQALPVYLRDNAWKKIGEQNKSSS